MLITRKRLKWCRELMDEMHKQAVAFAKVAVNYPPVREADIDDIDVADDYEGVHIHGDYWDGRFTEYFGFTVPMGFIEDPVAWEKQYREEKEAERLAKEKAEKEEKQAAKRRKKSAELEEMHRLVGKYGLESIRRSQ